MPETTSKAEARLRDLGIILPRPPTPVANYVAWKRAGDMLYLSGQGPRLSDGKLLTGLVGAEIDVKTAYDHARLVGIGLLAAMKEAVGDLDKVEVIKMLGMVRATPDFGEQPEVINGCSDLFVAVLGERGKHARSAVGMGSLPRGISVEIEAVCRVHE